MDTDKSEIKLLELPDWVKFVNDLVKKEEPLTARHPTQTKSDQ